MIKGDDKQMKPSDVKKKTSSKKAKASENDRTFLFPARKGHPAVSISAATREEANERYTKSLNK